MSSTLAYATAFIFLNSNQSAIVGAINGCNLGNAAGIFLTNSANPLSKTATILEKQPLCAGTTSPLTQLPGLSITWDGNPSSAITATYNGTPKAAAITRSFTIDCSQVASLGIQPCGSNGAGYAATRDVTSSTWTWIWIIVIILVILLILFLFYAAGH